LFEAVESVIKIDCRQKFSKVVETSEIQLKKMHIFCKLWLVWLTNRKYLRSR